MTSRNGSASTTAPTDDVTGAAGSVETAPHDEVPVTPDSSRNPQPALYTTWPTTTARAPNPHVITPEPKRKTRAVPDVPLLRTVTEWYCPNCSTTDTTMDAPLAPGQAGMARMHTCPGLHMLTAPLIRAGTRCKVEANLREDYQGREITQDGDDRRPYSSVVTTRDEGTDCAVLAPCAQLYG